MASRNSILKLVEQQILFKYYLRKLCLNDDDDVCFLRLKCLTLDKFRNIFLNVDVVKKRSSRTKCFVSDHFLTQHQRVRHKLQSTLSRLAEIKNPSPGRRQCLCFVTCGG